MDTVNGNGRLTTALVVHGITTLMERAIFAQRAGITYAGDRDLYKTFGYQRQLEYRDYRARYERGGIAQRIINAFPAATWHKPPTITEVEKPDETTKTAFEEAYEGLEQRHHLNQVFERADRLATLGHFSVVLLGVKATPEEIRQEGYWATPMKPMSSPDDLMFLTAYSEEHTRIVELVSEPTPLFGQPSMYEIDFNRGTSSETDSWMRPSLGGIRLGATRVHASRIIHIAENGLEDNIIGVPRLRAVWNNLDNLDKMLGAAAEICFRDAKQRFALKADAEARLDPEDKAALEAHVQELIHNFRDFITLQGIDLQQFIGHVPDMSGQIDKELDVIAGTLPIPKRLLIGSERGEQASSQDENNWGQSTIERQVHYAEPIILRQFIDRCTKYRLLPMPRKGYLLTWPDPKPLTEQEKALVALNWTKTYATYAAAAAQPIEQIVPIEIWLEDTCGWSKEQIERMMELVEQVKEQLDAEAREAAEQQRALGQGGMADETDDMDLDAEDDAEDVAA